MLTKEKINDLRTRMRQHEVDDQGRAIVRVTASELQELILAAGYDDSMFVTVTDCKKANLHLTEKDDNETCIYCDNK